MFLNLAHKWFEAEESRILSELFTFLRFKSVSSDPAFAAECWSCAHWLQEHLHQIGLQQVELISERAEDLPVLRASFRVPGAKKTILYYGHYDVYEAADLSAWQSPPFEPEMRDGRIFARGAQDNKGQTFYFLKAVEYLIASKQLDVNLEIILDGEEETTTSASLCRLMPSLMKDCAADLLMICDTDSASKDCATVILGLRGIISLTFEFSSENGEVHSGLGGVQPNCANRLIQAISGLFDSDGKPALKGFLKDVRPLSKEESELLPLQAKTIINQGLSSKATQTAVQDELLAKGFFPSLDVSALKIGEVSAAVRTVLPGRATVQITSRLVPDQNPNDCLAVLKEHFQSYLLPGMSMSVLGETIGSAGVRFSPSGAAYRLAREVLQEVTGCTPLYDWEGSSIPFVSWCVPEIVPEALIVGFGLDSDNVHGANESFALEQFRKGFAYSAALLARFAR
jgi:acetylornithine deacetylase/succinyl-diaminopimelate desuccinylase-like protein